MKNKNILIFILGVLVILGLTLYGVLLYPKTKKNKINTEILNLTKEEIANDCLELLKLEPQQKHLFCGVSETGRVIKVEDQELKNYLSKNNKIAIAFNLKELLKTPLQNLRKPGESLYYLSSSPHVCAFVYPDFSTRKPDNWELFPLTLLKSTLKNSVNYVSCTKALERNELLSFALVGNIVKEGDIFKQFKEVPFDNIKIELNLLNSEKEFSEGSLGGYYMSNPLKFVPFYRVNIPLK